MKKGITFLEIMMVMTVMAIISSLSIVNYQKFIANDELKQASMNLYMELRNLHQLAIQYDARTYVTFTTQYLYVYADTNKNGSPEAKELVKTIKLPTSVLLGIASGGPEIKPSDLGSLSGMNGNWNMQIEVKNDAVGTTNDGALYVSSPRLKKTTYCIGIASPMLSIKQYKWEGIWISL
jgi:Tfp pilus assembly protein FimT